MADRRLLGELLVEAGLVHRDDLEKALVEQRLRGGRLGYHLMRLGKVNPGSLFLFLQSHFGVISPELVEILRTGPAVDLLPPRLAHFYQMIPLRQEGGTLLLALSNVDNPNLIPAVAELTGLKVDPLICPPSLIREALEKFFPVHDEAGVIRDAVGENVLVLSDPAHDISPVAPDTLGPDASAFDWLRSLIAEAIHRHSREILVEPLREETRVAYRQKENVETSRVLRAEVRAPLVQALEDLSKLAGRGRTVPREGRFRLQHGDRKLAVLVTSLPGFHGDAYHLRIVEERIQKDTLEGMLEDYPEARAGLEAAVGRKRGLILLCAPEGHYREQILTALIGSLRWQVGRTVFLAGPDAVRIPGVDIREIDARRKLPFRELAAAALRERPDLLAVVRVGSREEIAVLFEAAAERLVVAGIRSADAFATLNELVRGGFLSRIREGRLGGVLGVRMVERVCEHCRKRYDLQEEFPNLLSGLNGAGLYFANTGCRACRGAGVTDLEPAFEFLPGDPAVAEPLAHPSIPEAIRREQVQAGGKTLFASVMARAATGEVDVREPLRLLLYEGRGAA